MADKTIPLDPRTWLTDPNLRNMSRWQRSDYMDLLCLMMLEDDAGIEANDEKIIEKLDTCEEDWLVIKERLILKNGRYYQRRLKRDHDKKYKKKSTQEITIFHEKQELVYPYTSDSFMQIWKILIKEPKWKNKSFSALQSSLIQLSKSSEQDAIQMMRNTIAGGWQGLFEIKHNNNGTRYQVDAKKAGIDALQQRAIAVLSGNKTQGD